MIKSMEYNYYRRCKEDETKDHIISGYIGRCIFPEYKRQRYCAEAAKLALKYAFEDWDAHKVVAMCNEYNIASFMVMEKLGMVREGIFREELPWHDKWVNQLFYCILDSEYRKMRMYEKIG